MQILSSFITGFCVSCVLLGVLYMLCPTGSISSSVKYVFCLCFVCCIVATATTFPKIDFSQFEKHYNNELLTEENAAFYSKEVFSEALRQEKINFEKIDVYTNKLKDGSIVINRVEIYSNQDASKIKQIIGSKDYEVVVINE
ncbi:MAG: hypothetical protein IKJ93_06340 [Clostridia bacterium]|nr:hypothetical protein [Clostridia bacterium]